MFSWCGIKIPGDHTRLTIKHVVWSQLAQVQIQAQSPISCANNSTSSLAIVKPEQICKSF